MYDFLKCKTVNFVVRNIIMIGGMFMHQFHGNLQKNSQLGWFITKDFLRLSQLKGIILTVIVILSFEYLNQRGIGMLHHATIFSLAIYFALFSGGIILGLVSTLMTIVYSFYFFSLPGQLLNFTAANLEKAIITSVTLMITFILGVYIYQQFFQSHHRLRESERKFRNLFLHANDGILLYHLDQGFYPNEIIDVNPRAQLQLGFTKEELLNRSFLDIDQGLDQEQVKLLCSKLRKDKYASIESVHLAKNGEQIPVRLTLQYFKNNGKAAAMCTIRDLREEKIVESLKHEIDEKTQQLKEALRRDQLRTEFFSNVSHELRTPINVIFSTLQLFCLLIEEPMNINQKDSAKKYIHIMKQNCYRLLRLINNIIDLSKIDFGFLELDLKNQDIVYLIESITLSVAEYIENKSIELIFDTDVEEKVIACDPDKIERIMLNLLSNAVKFTPKGGHIEVRLMDENERIKVVVSDTGVGIPQEKMNVLFERFKQINRSLDKDQHSSGIGLSLVKSLVELHGGSIEVVSQLGQGTAFTIYLPGIALQDNENEAESEKHESCGYVEKINVEFSDIYSKESII
ncbi:sensor histidine kinase [Alkaliphilus crotonatoxidans]